MSNCTHHGAACPCDNTEFERIQARAADLEFCPSSGMADAFGDAVMDLAPAELLAFSEWVVDCLNRRIAHDFTYTQRSLQTALRKVGTAWRDQAETEAAADIARDDARAAEEKAEDRRDYDDWRVQ
jgi:hypothetical protein